MDIQEVGLETIPEEFHPGYWEFQLGTYLKETTDDISWGAYLVFLQERGLNPDNLKQVSGGEIWRYQIGFLIEIERVAQSSLSLELSLRDLWNCEGSEEEFGKALFQSCTHSEPLESVRCRRIQGCFVLSFLSQEDYEQFLRKNAFSSTLIDASGFFLKDLN